MSRRKTAVAPDPALDQAGAPLESLADPATDNGQSAPPAKQESATDTAPASSFAKKQYKPDPDPFGTEFIKAGDNVVRLFKSGKDRAWIIRFDKNPNEGRAKDDPHPVLAFLKKEAGYRWGFSDADGKGGWGKPWGDGRFNYTEHMEARTLLRKCAEMLGPVQGAERTPF